VGGGRGGEEFDVNIEHTMCPVWGQHVLYKVKPCHKGGERGGEGRGGEGRGGEGRGGETRESKLKWVWPNAACVIMLILVPKTAYTSL
jgi:hypothetical protein